MKAWLNNQDKGHVLTEYMIMTMTMFLALSLIHRGVFLRHPNGQTQNMLEAIGHRVSIQERVLARPLNFQEKGDNR